MAQNVAFNITFIDKFSNVGRKLKSSVDKTTQSMRKFDAQSGKMARGLKKIGNAAKNAAGSIKTFGKRLSIAATLPIAAFGVLAVSAASDAAEMESALDIQFGKSANAMRAWADNTAKQLARGSTDIREQAQKMGVFLGGLGFAGAGLDDMTKKLVVLTQDIGSFRNVSPERVFLALQGAMVGNNESLKTLGISLNKREVEMKAMAQGARKVGGQFTKLQLSTAAYALVVEKTSKDQGDAARTSQSFTNQMILLRQSMRTAKVAIGNELIPALLPLVKGFTKIIQKLASANPKFLKWGVIIAGVAAVIGPLLIALGFMITAVAAITAPILLGIAAVAAFIGVLVLLWNWATKIGDVMAMLFKISPLGAVFTGIGAAIGFLADKFAPLNALLEGFQKKFNAFIDSPAGSIAAFFGIGGEVKQTNKIVGEIVVTTKDKAGVIANVQSKFTERPGLPNGGNMRGALS